MGVEGAVNKILQAAVTEESTITEPQLDTVLNMLHQQVCAHCVGVDMMYTEWGCGCGRGDVSVFLEAAVSEESTINEIIMGHSTTYINSDL